MKNLDYKATYERHLPHIQPPGATLFVTYRLAGLIPADLLQELTVESDQVEQELEKIQDIGERTRQAAEEQRRLFAMWDAALDRADDGPRWLSNPQVAEVVVDSLHFLDGNVYDLDTYCLMSNHAHVVFTPLELDDGNGRFHALQAIMHSHKRHTAFAANRILNRNGQFWQHESYDHVARDEAELHRIRNYVLNNPAKAGLVDRWDDWPWSYCKWIK